MQRRRLPPGEGRDIRVDAVAAQTKIDLLQQLACLGRRRQGGKNECGGKVFQKSSPRRMIVMIR